MFFFSFLGTANTPRFAMKFFSDDTGNDIGFYADFIITNDTEITKLDPMKRLMKSLTPLIQSEETSVTSTGRP